MKKVKAASKQSETPVKVVGLNPAIEEKRDDPNQPSSKPAAKLNLFGWRALGLVLCGLGLGVALVTLWPWFSPRQTDANTPQELLAAPDSAVALRPGPWGNLEALPIYIEPPDEYIPVGVIGQMDRRWSFTGFTPDQLLALFQSADLTTEQRAELTDISKWQVDHGIIYVTPSKDLILSLTPEARKTIYVPMFLDHESNMGRLGQAFPADHFSDYFAESGLPDETIDLIKKLSFPYGKLIIFCDVQLVLDTLPKPDQKLHFLKALLRKATLVLRLHITPDSDINELEHYWIRAGWGLDLRPMFESLAKLPHGARLDLVELLPPIPSADIYNYSFPSLKPEDQHKDCRWTSLNFFRDVPDDRFVDPNVDRQTLANDYYPALSDPRYGDVVILSKPNGNIIHMAVYIAADIVYTKNSGNFRDPFILMTFSDMVLFIPRAQKGGHMLRQSPCRHRLHAQKSAVLPQGRMPRSRPDRIVGLVADQPDFMERISAPAVGTGGLNQQLTDPLPELGDYRWIVFSRVKMEARYLKNSELVAGILTGISHLT